MCSSPLSNDKNIKQIKLNISILNISILNIPKYTKRKGPTVSATFYDNGDIKLGNNKYFWIKKNNKWVQISEKPITITIEINIKKINKKQLTYLEKLPYIAQHNTNPIFIVSSKNTKSSLYNIKLILTESYKENLIKLGYK